MKNLKYLTSLFLVGSLFVSFNVNAQIQVSDYKLNEIENRLDNMSAIELSAQKDMLMQEDASLSEEEANTQNPERIKAIKTRRAEILSELSMLQKFLLLVGSAGILDQVLEDDDNTPPVISLNGSNPVTIELGSSYSDAGASTDTGEPVTVSGSVDANSVGVYILTYNSVDSSGNVSSPVTRTVNVVDTTAPVVTVNGASPVTVELGSTYTDAGATASDLSGSVSVITSGSVDTDALGSYTLTYTSTDASGNTGTASRTVNVVDTTAPVITVTGDNPVTVELGSTYTDAGATASDLSGDITVTTTGTVDADTVGTYTLTYNASDASGNAATAVTRTVNVVDTTPPTITSASSFTVNENETAIATLAATDLNSEATITWSISGSGLSISTAGVLTFSPAADYETKKSYSATVSASDGSNSATQDITITVVDLNDNAPTITSSASFSVNENESVLGTVTATDPDTGSSGAFKSNPITFSISGSELSINSSSGAISLASGLAADYETKYSYTATVTATDGTNSTTQDITITIVDLNDNAPVFTSSAAFSVDENQTSIGTVTATDVDTGS